MYRETLTADELETLAKPAAFDRQPSLAQKENSEEAKQTDNALAELHLRFAESLASVLTSYAGRDVVARMRSANRGLYGQFVFGQPIPTCCAIARAEPIESEFFFAMGPSLLFPLIDRVLGSKQIEPAPSRPLSEIERSIAKLIFSGVLEKYADQWQQSLSLVLTIDRLEHNTQRLNALPGSAHVYLVQYDLLCEPDAGRLELCIPWNATQQIRERLAANQ